MTINKWSLMKFYDTLDELKDLRDNFEEGNYDKIEGKDLFN